VSKVGQDGTRGSLGTGSGDLGAAQAVAGAADFGPIVAVSGEHVQRVADQFLGRIGSRYAVPDDVIERAEDGRIEHLQLIRGGQDQTVRIVGFDELEERVQHAPDLADFVSAQPGRYRWVRIRRTGSRRT